jgi:hypothetical protein
MCEIVGNLVILEAYQQTTSKELTVMTYKELIAKLVAIEVETGLYLSDQCVDLQNASDPTSDASLFSAAANAAGERAEEAGHNINKLLGFKIY